MKKRFLSALVLLCLSFGAVAQVVTPVADVPHGFYDEPFTLNITCDDEAADIRYTTDGTMPSATNGRRYEAPLSITGTTVLRAVAIDGATAETSAAMTVTYLFLDDVIRQDNSPEGYPEEWGDYATRSGKAVADYEMDPEMTADTDFCRLLKEGFRSLPIASVVMDPGDLFNDEENDSTGGIYIYTGAPSGSGEPGRGWERPASFELFDAQGKHDLQVDCGIKIHGGHSRLPEKSPKHSFRLVFRPEFGPKKLKYPLFGEDEPKKLNAVVLRTAFCNSWHHQENSQRKLAVYCRDMWAKRTQKEMGQLTTNGIYAHLFINGLYWGMYNPTERIDDDFCEAHLGGDKEEYDVIKVEEYGTKHTVMADAGTMEKWEALFALAEEVAEDDVEAYLRIQGLDAQGNPDPETEPLLDVENFIDYMLINYYGGNSDWDSHNWLAVRNREQGNEGFHFICWDSEHILKGLTDNVLDKKTAESPTYLFRRLIKNRLFKRAFIDRVQMHCADDGVLTPERCADRFRALDAVIDTALYCEQARWGDYRRDVHRYTKKGELYTKETHYDPQRDFLLETYFPGRTETFLDQLVEKGWFPTVEAPEILYRGEPAFRADTIEAAEGLTLQGEGELYYTVDGEAPVSWLADEGGKVTGSAATYDGGKIFPQEEEFTLKAIAYADDGWSPVRERRFVVRLSQETGIAGRETDGLRLTADRRADGSYVLTFTLSAPATADLRIYDAKGCLLLSPLRRTTLSAGIHRTEIPAGTLSPGVYICRLKTDHAAGMVKLGVN